MRKFLLGWLCLLAAFAAAAGIASIIRSQNPVAGTAMTLISGFISWRAWAARKNPPRPPAPAAPRPWER